MDEDTVTDILLEILNVAITHHINGSITDIQK